MKLPGARSGHPPLVFRLIGVLGPCNRSEKTMTDKEAFDLIAAHAVPGAPSVETIVALKSGEQASLSPGAYQVLTGAVEHKFASPLGALRWKLRKATADMSLCTARDVRVSVAGVLDAPEWEQAAAEANALRGERDVLVRLLLEADKVVSTIEGECQEEWGQLAALRRAIMAATIPHRPEEADLLSLRACIGA